MEGSYPKWFPAADRAVVRIYKIVSYGAALALLAIMMIAFVDVCGEKLAKAGLKVSGISNYSSWIGYLHVVVVFLTCGFVTLDRGHTVVDILTNRLPRGLRRATGFAGLLMGAVVGGFLTYRGLAGLLPDAIRYHTTITTSSNSFVQWPFILVYVLGCAMLCVSFLWAMVRFAVGYRPPAPDAFSENNGEGGDTP